MNKIIPNFKEHYKLDICNLIVLTDGEGNTSFGHVNDMDGYNSRVRSGRRELILEDEKTKMSYPLNDMADYRMIESKLQERAVLSLLKDRHDINIVGIFLDASSHGKRILQRTLEDFIGWKYYNVEAHKAARAMCKKTGIAAIQTKGYDEYYIIPMGTIKDVFTELEIDGSMTVGKIKNAFKKNQNTKFGNKVLVNRMMDIIA
jgi:5S rRNA maturation endonuclease (ribonuclease M5)